MWIYKGLSYDADKIYECSECGKVVYENKTPYCPYCANKQEEENEKISIE